MKLTSPMSIIEAQEIYKDKLARPEPLNYGKTELGNSDMFFPSLVQCLHDNEGVSFTDIAASSNKRLDEVIEAYNK